MPDTKTWWQSRTIWLQIVSAFFAILAAFHILPTGLDQEQVVGAIMGAVAIATLVLRIRSTHVIASPFRVASPASTPAAASISRLCEGPKSVASKTRRTRPRGTKPG